MDSPYASLMDVDGSSYLEDNAPQQTQHVPAFDQTRHDGFRTSYLREAAQRQALAATPHAARPPSTSPPSAGAVNKKRSFDSFHDDGLKDRMLTYKGPLSYITTVSRNVHWRSPCEASPLRKKASPTTSLRANPTSRKPCIKPSKLRPNWAAIPYSELRAIRARGECNPAQLEALARVESPEHDGLRRAYSMVTTSIYQNAASLYQRVWGFITSLFQTQEQEIISVQIDPSGSKRRAVSGSAPSSYTHLLSSSSPSISPSTYLTSQIPGCFPDVEMTDASMEAAEVSTQLTTPPDSRPGSREGPGKEQDNPMAAAQKLSTMTEQRPKNVTPMKSSTQEVNDSLLTNETSPTNTDTTISTEPSPEVKRTAVPLAHQEGTASTNAKEARAQLAMPLQQEPARVGLLPSAQRHIGSTTHGVHAQQAISLQQQPPRVGRLTSLPRIPQNYTPAVIGQDLDKLVAMETAQAARATSSELNNAPNKTYRSFDRRPGQSAKDWIEERNSRLARHKTPLPLDARQYVAPSRRQLRAEQAAAARAEAQSSVSESVLRNMQKDAQVEKLVEKAKQTINSPPSNQKLNHSANEHGSAKKDDVQENVAAETSPKVQETSHKDELDLTKKEDVHETVVAEGSEKLQNLSISDADRSAQQKVVVADLSDGDITFSSIGEIDMDKYSDWDFSKYNEKQKIIRPLPEEWGKRVDDAMATKNRREVLATTVEGTGLSRHDFGCLLPQAASADEPNGWLNDEIVNAWIAAIVDEKNKQKDYNKSGNRVPLFVSYPSAWYTTYKSKGNSMAAISRWSRRKGIQGPKLLESERIFFPINTGAHWQLLIISPKKREIEFLNSINNGGHDARSQGFFAVAREWLQMELKEAYVAGEWVDRVESVSAQQTNSDDCGAFVCFNALISAKEKGEFGVLAAEGYEMQPFGRRLMAAVLLNGGFTGDWSL